MESNEIPHRSRGINTRRSAHIRDPLFACPHVLSHDVNDGERVVMASIELKQRMAAAFDLPAGCRRRSRRKMRGITRHDDPDGSHANRRTDNLGASSWKNVC
jgi:hypothetical protein